MCWFKWIRLDDIYLCPFHFRRNSLSLSLSLSLLKDIRLFHVWFFSLIFGQSRLSDPMNVCTEFLLACLMIN